MKAKDLDSVTCNMQMVMSIVVFGERTKDTEMVACNSKTKIHILVSGMTTKWKEEHLQTKIKIGISMVNSKTTVQAVVH